MHEWLPSASKLHALAVTPRPAPERLHVRAVVLLVYAFTKCLRLIVMPRLSAPHFRLAQISPVSKRALRANIRRLAKFARKIVVEIPSQKML